MTEPTSGDPPDRPSRPAPPGEDPGEPATPGRGGVSEPPARPAGPWTRGEGAAWTLPFAVATALATGLPWASCPGCAGPTVFTAWSLPDSGAIGVSTGAEYGLCSIGTLLSLVLTVAGLLALRPAMVTSAAVAAAVATGLAGYACVTVTGHDLNLEAGPPITAGCAAVLTITLVCARSRLVVES